MIFKRSAIFLLALVTSLGLVQAPSANAVTANNGAGGTFTYTSGATNQQMMLSACESWAGASNCSQASCGYFSYYYKTSLGSCTCSLAIGAYEFIYSNTDPNSYPNVGSDYGQSNAVSIVGKVPFVRKKNVAQCSTADVWLLTLGNAGTPLNVTSTLTNPSYTGNPAKGVFTTLSATANVAGAVTFYANGRLIAGCKNRPTNGSFIATCNWRPLTQSPQTVTALFTPTDNTYTLATSSANAAIRKRTTAR